MAGRNNKVGLDYFELDCHMDEKVRLLQAEYGLKGFAVFVKLLQTIYGGNGYYCEWTLDRELLFASENGLDSGSLQLLRGIVSACIRRDIFSEKLLNKYGILTSSGVQKQYLKATVKREVVSMKKEYLLIPIPENSKNVVISTISSGRNTISGGRNAQSRVEKSRVEKSRAEKSIESGAESRFTPPTVDDVKAYCLEKGYKVDSGRFVDFYTSKGWLVGKNKMKDWKAAVRNWARQDEEKNGNSFANNEPVKPKKNGFQNFKQRDYNFDDLAKALINR